MSHTSVTEMPCTQVNVFLVDSLKSSTLTWPSLSTSICSKMAVERSSVNVRASLLNASGKPVRYLMKASLGTLPSAPPIVVIRSSKDVSFSCMCSFSASVMNCFLALIRNFSPPSSTSGAQNSAASLIVSSISVIFAAASSKRAFALNFCSWVLATFFAFVSSEMAVAKRPFKSLTYFVLSSLPFASLNLAFKKFLASSALALVSFSKVDKVFHCSERSSSLGSSVAKGLVASVTFSTSASNVVIFSPASCIWVAFLRTSVSFLN
mmetsp:Transcript_62410/g.108710  ORF Transcript_62410/g.108710 Transcript_62410/m.108710 type:complete len:265 (+) Transcript_62410:1658-2452(+)